MGPTRVAVYDSLGSDYERAFDVFLAHTDQKDKARSWLDRAVGRLKTRRTFVDAGAGTGKVTAWYTGRFEKTIAIEPNPHLRQQLRTNCPAATILDGPILECMLHDEADFVLSSHVFYYIPADDWPANLERLASFLAPQGVLVIVLQNAGTDCMKLVDHFHGRRFDLPALGREFPARHNGAFDCRVETVESHIETSDPGSSYTIAEFMVNLLPMSEPPIRSELEDFVHREFAASGAGHRFSCSQDFLVIERR